jgi:hypothetical protein
VIHGERECLLRAEAEGPVIDRFRVVVYRLNGTVVDAAAEEGEGPIFVAAQHSGEVT